MHVRAVFAAIATFTFLSGAVSAMTAEELVAKNLQARGGEAKLRAVTTMHAVGTQRFGGGQDRKVETWAIAGEGFRSEVSLQGMTAVQAWDGQEAWVVSPFRGRRDPQKISGDDAKGLIERADVTGPLVDYKAKGNKIEYLGTEDIEGSDAHKLRVTLKNGDTQYLFLDPDQFLEIRVIARRVVRGQEEVSTTDLGEYEMVDGMYFPFEIGRLHLDKVELNQPVDRKMFAFPGGAR